MLKITLLKTLYYEFDHLLSRDGHHYEHRDKRFRTIHKTYPGIPEIASVTMEERYLPKSVLYYIWINDEKKEADLNDTKLCRWIFSFVKENCPDYLKNEPELLSHMVKFRLIFFYFILLNIIYSTSFTGIWRILTIISVENPSLPNCIIILFRSSWIPNCFCSSYALHTFAILTFSSFSGI